MMNYYQNYGQFNPNEMQNRINQLQQMLGQYQNMQQPIQTSNDKGIYVYVKDYQEVVNYPTSADGKATIFIGNGIMWSKKIMDGKNCIQAYSFAPMNEVQAQSQNDTQQQTNIPEQLLDNICERLNLIEEKLNAQTIPNDNESVKKYGKN